MKPPIKNKASNLPTVNIGGPINITKPRSKYKNIHDLGYGGVKTKMIQDLKNRTNGLSFKNKRKQGDCDDAREFTIFNICFRETQAGQLFGF